MQLIFYTSNKNLEEKILNMVADHNKRRQTLGDLIEVKIIPCALARANVIQTLMLDYKQLESLKIENDELLKIKNAVDVISKAIGSAK